MRINFEDQNRVLTKSEREFAHRSLLFELSRYSNEIRTLEITVGQSNRRTTVHAMQCNARVDLGRLGTVELNQTCAELKLGIPHLSRQLGRAVARRVESQRTYSRSPAIHSWPTDGMAKLRDQTIKRPNN